MKSPTTRGWVFETLRCLENAETRASWRPRADVYRGRQGWLIKFDLAGVRVEDIELAVSDTRLVLRGVRRDWVLAEGHRTYSMEITYSRFERAIDLPSSLEGTRIETEYRDGMLLVYLHPAP